MSERVRAVQIARSLTIRSEPEVVFRWIEEPELASQWQPDVAEYTITRPSGDVVGTEFREVLRSATGSMEMHGRITEYEKNARMGFDVKGTGIHVHTAYSLTAVPHGTQLDVEADIHIGGRLSWLVDRLVRRRFARQFDSELARLRALAETTPRGST